ncbi:MAG: AAA family ATPase [Gammaproteobacteria bacterium]|nr:AAA family ATPase [Gammaproteobacteria bacterium]
MKKILIVNPKGGCGKTTIAANLASYYALWDVPVALIDYDPQHSSLEWLDQRPADLNQIMAVNGAKGRVNFNLDVERIVIDAPARTTDIQTQRLFEKADVVLVPVLPSAIDIRAIGHFVGQLMLGGMLKTARIGLVANRVKENTIVFHNLERFLKTLDIPLVTHLRDSQNYIRASEGGFGIFEMSPYQVDKDIEQWRSLIEWIEEK